MSYFVDYDFSAFSRHGRMLDDVAESQIPFAAAKTLTQAAKIAVEDDLPAEMDRAFDRPTRYTKRVLAYLPATKTKLHAEILPRVFAGKGNVAWKFLDPEVVGGARLQKRGEKRLSAALGEHVFLIPARGTRLDASGNISRGTMVKVLSGLGALADPYQNATGASAKRAKRKVAAHGGINGSKRRVTNSQYFIGRSKKTHKPLAIYEFKSKGKVKPVMVIVRRAPQYRPRFKFAPTIERSVQKNLPRLFERNLEAAIRTARH